MPTLVVIVVLVAVLGWLLLRGRARPGQLSDDRKPALPGRQRGKLLTPDLLDSIEDPREAAAAMMVAVAEADGTLSPSEFAAIVSEMEMHFDATAEEAEALIDCGRTLSAACPRFSEVLRRLAPLIRHHCTDDECNDLIEMLGNVATADGAADERIVAELARLSRALQSA